MADGICCDYLLADELLLRQSFNFADYGSFTRR
jgi:hypothetical protein